jgi:beta-lactamase class A
MTVLREAERTPEMMVERVPVDPRDQYASQNIPPKQPLSPGEYTVKELLERAIVYSDNVATLALADHLKQGEISTTMSAFGFNEQSNGTLASPRAYSSIFRALFNSSYLTRERSKYALELLSRTDFRDGLVAGVPAGLSVAHKFGERRRAETGEVQMHDCGIVYHPARPYFLCVMTRGRELEALASVIRDLSRKTYERVDQGLSGVLPPRQP